MEEEIILPPILAIGCLCGGGGLFIGAGGGGRGLPVAADTKLGFVGGGGGGLFIFFRFFAF
jgi:hypothetical protein